MNILFEGAYDVAVGVFYQYDFLLRIDLGDDVPSIFDPFYTDKPDDV